MCVRACVRAYVCVCVCERERERERERKRDRQRQTDTQKGREFGAHVYVGAILCVHNYVTVALL